MKTKLAGLATLLGLVAAAAPQAAAAGCKNCQSASNATTLAPVPEPMFNSGSQPARPAPSAMAGHPGMGFAAQPYGAPAAYGGVPAYGAMPGYGRMPVYGRMPSYGAMPAYGVVPAYGAMPGGGPGSLAPVAPPPGTLGYTYRRYTRPVPTDLHPRTAMLEVYGAPSGVRLTVHGTDGFADEKGVWHFQTETPPVPGLSLVRKVLVWNDDGSLNQPLIRTVRLIPGRIVELDY